MHIENMHQMIECLVSKSKAYMDNGFEGVDSCELSKATDAIKDLCEAYYYASVSKAMEEAEKDPMMAQQYYNSNYNAVREPARMTYDMYSKEPIRKAYAVYNKDADWNNTYHGMDKWDSNEWNENEYNTSKRRYMNAISTHKDTQKSREEYTDIFEKDIKDMCGIMDAKEKTEFKTELARIVNAM